MSNFRSEEFLLPEVALRDYLLPTQTGHWVFRKAGRQHSASSNLGDLPNQSFQALIQSLNQMSRVATIV
jgi:hypothetical protein